MSATALPAATPPPIHLGEVQPAFGRWQDGGWIQVVGRYSGSSGTRAYRLASDDLREACDVVKDRFGVDIESALPSGLELIEMLRASAPVVSLIDGKRVYNRFVVLNDPTSRVRFLLSAGTAVKHSPETGQPFTERLLKECKELGPVALVSSDFARVGRHPWLAAPIMLYAECYETLIVTGTRVFDLARNGTAEVQAFLDLLEARASATSTSVEGRKGQTRATGSVMAGGKVAYHLHAPAPAGLATAHVNALHAGDDRRILYLDSPSFRPLQAEVEKSNNRVTDAAGAPVDQVDNVRFLLANLGRPQWPTRRLIAELTRRRFSTEQLRNEHTSSATIADAVNPRSVLRTIIANRDFYETGVLRRSVSPDLPGVVIANVMPEGGWAAPSDFRRIRRYLETGSGYASSASSTFAGLRLIHDGQPARLLSADVDGEPGYRLELLADGGAPAAPPGGIRILHSDVAGAIIDALASGDELVLQAADVLLDDRNDGLTEVESALEQNGEARRVEENAQIARRQLLEQRRPNGELVCTGGPRTHIEARLSASETETLPTLERKARKLIDQRDLILTRRELLAVEPDALLALAAALADPSGLSFRPVLLAGLRRVRTTSLDARARRRPIELTGHLAINHAGIDYLLPLRRICASSPDELRTALSPVEILTAMVEADPTSEPSLPRYERDALGSHLAALHNGAVLLAVDDPRLRRLWASLILDGTLTDDELGERLSEPPTLVAHVRELLVSGRFPSGRHLGPVGRVVVAMHATAAGGDDGVAGFDAVAALIGSTQQRVREIASSDPARWSSIRGIGYRITPCGCGSVRLAPSRLPEISGPLCLDCRRDGLDHFWPQAYDIYAAHPDLWAASP